MNPWQTWLQAIQNNSSTNIGSTMSNAAASFSGNWNQSIQQWQQNMENTWASPASYWQAVSSIQTARSKAIAEFMQQQPQYFAGLFQCTTFPQLLEHCTRWNTSLITNIISLNTLTQAHRGNLMQQWQRQFAYLSTSQQALQGMWKKTQGSITPTITPWQAPPQSNTTGNTSSSVKTETKAEAQTSPKPQAQAEAPIAPQVQTQQPKPEVKAEPKVEPKAETKVEAKPETRVETKPEVKAEQPKVQSAAAAQPVQQATQSLQPESTKTQGTVTQIQTPTDQLHLLNGTNGSAISPVSSVVPAGTMSSTATSVMRSAAGTTIAAAAAARRSVVARRSSGRRRSPR